MYKEHI